MKPCPSFLNRIEKESQCKAVDPGKRYDPASRATEGHSYERSLLKTFYLKYVCNLAAVAWPAAALSGAPTIAREARRADSRHPGRKRGKPFSHTIIDGEPLKCLPKDPAHQSHHNDDLAIPNGPAPLDRGHELRPVKAGNPLEDTVCFL